MVMMSGCRCGSLAFGDDALLVGEFKLDSDMADTVVYQGLTDGSFELGARTRADDVHSGVIMVAVHAPDVNMMNVLDVSDR